MSTKKKVLDRDQSQGNESVFSSNDVPDIFKGKKIVNTSGGGKIINLSKLPEGTTIWGTIVGVEVSKGKFKTNPVVVIDQEKKGVHVKVSGSQAITDTLRITGNAKEGFNVDETKGDLVCFRFRKKVKIDGGKRSFNEIDILVAKDE
jgi:hypothetical protein